MLYKVTTIDFLIFLIYTYFAKCKTHSQCQLYSFLCFRQIVFIAVCTLTRVQMVNVHVVFCGNKRTSIPSQFQSSRPRPHTLSVSGFLTYRCCKKNGTCMRSKITTLSLPASHPPNHRCKTGSSSILQPNGFWIFVITRQTTLTYPDISIL